MYARHMSDDGAVQAIVIGGTHVPFVMSMTLIWPHKLLAWWQHTQHRLRAAQCPAITSSPSQPCRLLTSNVYTHTSPQGVSIKGVAQHIQARRLHVLQLRRSHWHPKPSAQTSHPKLSCSARRKITWDKDDCWFAHCCHLDASEIRSLSARGIGVAHCPSSNMRLASGICPVRSMLNEGVNVGLGIDGSASNDSGHMLAEARLACLLQRAGGDPNGKPLMRGWIGELFG